MDNCFSVGVALEKFIIRSWGSIVGHANYRLERVQLWLSKAETMITEAEKLVANGPQQMNNLCLGGFASKNCLSTYKFGKKVAKMLQAINDLISKGVFDKVAESQPAASVVVRPEERPIAQQPTIEKVWNCIVDKDVGIIGLYGLGGVGKTTLLTQINNKFSTRPNGFDVVIWALVSNGYDIGKIQNKIGGNIGFSAESWKNKSVEEKAVDIYGVLRIKRFVVCGEMEAREKIKVECLEPKEAWKLFQDKVGDETLNSHPDIRKLAKQVDERDGEDFVKMHDVIRDMVLWIVCELEAKENNYFVKAGAQLFEEPDVKIWECAKRMSVMKNNIEDTRETPKCPNLHSLLLIENKLKVINDGFLQFIPHLTVLNLSNNSPLQAANIQNNELDKDYPEEDNVLNGGNENLIEELKRLQHLNILNVTWLILVPFRLVQCIKIEEILSQGKFGEVADVRVPYPVPILKLEKLVLCSLWKLKSVYWDVLPFPCLKYIFVGICPELKKLPLNSDSAKGNRITIDGNEDWWAEIEW
ncbi:hypothetical protein Gogos_005226 [Gossypium gossypioides]|uniref:NB-ARC domain-containing protein n=1 Tax=Gossypium gossypioides TaxID=34282 RepID=A0A7J9CJ01_GOSGO|nr:hypothetical protein [Gossypium gossypioides]